MSKHDPTGGAYYADYLKLGELLSAQAPESARQGRPAHDEMLFIIVHQAYELWFKQILHELDRIQADFGGDVVEDEYLGRIVHGLDRINEILKLLIQQLEVLETMTPLDFLDFRDFLFPASGFQSRAVSADRDQARARARRTVELRGQAVRRHAGAGRPSPHRRRRGAARG